MDRNWYFRIFRFEIDFFLARSHVQCNRMNWGEVCTIGHSEQWPLGLLHCEQMTNHDQSAAYCQCWTRAARLQLPDLLLRSIYTFFSLPPFFQSHFEFNQNYSDYYWYYWQRRIYATREAGQMRALVVSVSDSGRRWLTPSRLMFVIRCPLPSPLPEERAQFDAIVKAPI